MDDSEFNSLADRALKHIETGLERSGADLDFSMVASGVLEIELADGSKIIVNRHSAAKEVWVAARSGGYTTRAYPDPAGLYAAIPDAGLRLQAKLMGETGCRTEGVGAPARGSNPLTAANLLGISRVSVFCAVRDGRLAGGYIYEGGPIIIELAALEQYRPRRKNRRKLATIEKRTGPSGDLH